MTVTATGLELAAKLEHSRSLPALVVLGANLSEPQGEISPQTLELIAFAPDQDAAAELARDWREQLDASPGVTSFSVRDPRTRTIRVLLHHADEGALAVARRKLSARLARRDKILSVLEPTPAPERLLVSLHPMGEAIGVTSHAISEVLRAATTGVEVARLQRGRDEFRILVRRQQPPLPVGTDPISALGNLTVATPGGGAIAINEIASIGHSYPYVPIERVDGRRAVTIVVTVDGRDQRRIAGAIADNELTALEKEIPGLSGTVETD